MIPPQKNYNVQHASLRLVLFNYSALMQNSDIQ